MINRFLGRNFSPLIHRQQLTTVVAMALGSGILLCVCIFSLTITLASAWVQWDMRCQHILKVSKLPIRSFAHHADADEKSKHMGTRPPQTDSQYTIRETNDTFSEHDAPQPIEHEEPKGKSSSPVAPELKRSTGRLAPMPLEKTQENTTAKRRRKISVLADNQSLMEDGLQIKPIGIVRSVYRLCVGTPRQGLLAPNGRGCIDLFTLGNSSPASSVEGLEEFSHIWIVFIFHRNTQSENSSQRIKSKIAPPAYGGQKVGIFATRSPHRFNPIGMTLCKLDRIERLDKRNVRLHISGMDLVDGTPVLDIKPYVPVYDSMMSDVRLPNWVEGGLSLKRSVIVNESARKELQTILQENPDALEFYGPNHGDVTIEETMEKVLDCIQDVLAVDVRSSYQTKKSRAGKFKAERSTHLQDAAMKLDTQATENYCTQQFDNLLVHFEISEQQSPRGKATKNSGAVDTLIVTSIELLGD